MTARAIVLDQLEQDWAQRVARGELDEALARWRYSEPSLAFSDGDDLLTHLAHRPGAGSTRLDGVLSALIRLAPTDPLAARLLVCQFLPCLKRMIAGGARPLDRDEWIGLLVATSFEVIRTYPLAHRPRSIAANIACDIRKRAFAAVGRRRHELRELGRRSPQSTLHEFEPGDVDPAFGAVEASALLRWAIRTRLIDESTARLLVLTRVHDLTFDAVAALLGGTPGALQRRRHRAERRLARALASQAA